MRSAADGLIIADTVTGSHAVVTLEGELDVANAHDLREHLHRVIEQGAVTMGVDASGLSFMDSTGLSVLVETVKTLRRRDGSLSILHPTPAVHRLLTISGLLEVLDVQEPGPS